MRLLRRSPFATSFLAVSLFEGTAFSFQSVICLESVLDASYQKKKKGSGY